MRKAKNAFFGLIYKAPMRFLVIEIFFKYKTIFAHLCAHGVNEEYINA